MIWWDTHVEWLENDRRSPVLPLEEQDAANRREQAVCVQGVPSELFNPWSIGARRWELAGEPPTSQVNDDKLNSGNEIRVRATPIRYVWEQVGLR
jgi:hypothetical protein